MVFGVDRKERLKHKKICKNCGLIFYSNFGQVRFCSASCSNIFHKLRTKTIRHERRFKYKKCTQCGKYFETYYGHKTYCSKKCLNKEMSKRYKAKKVPKYNITCLSCGKEFIGPIWFKYCSSKCREISKYRRRRSYAKLNPSTNSYLPGVRERRSLISKYKTSKVDNVVKRINAIMTAFNDGKLTKDIIYKILEGKTCEAYRRSY
jgi:predicted nucleic acid-binding Zn ribbon protein